MDLPKRFFTPGSVPEIDKINNRCTLSILSLVKQYLEAEYKIVLQDPVFGSIVKMHENGLGYSARLIHSILCKQLMTDKKHELWFRETKNENWDTWEKDGGFWSNLLESNAGITLKMIKDVHIKTANKWSRDDRLRLVYVCIIAGLVMAQSIYIHIPHKYIMLVMDLERLHRYPWGLKSFDFLVANINKSSAGLREGKSYTLDGFSLALQIWLMEAMPVLGTMMSTKVKDAPVTIHRCTNWSGFSALSFGDISRLESTFRNIDDIYPFISCTGDFDVVDSAEYVRDDEMTDGRVDCLKNMISHGKDWSTHVWEIDGAGDESVPNRGKKRMLWERAVTKESHIDDGLQSFIRDLFQSALKPLEEKIDNLQGKTEGLETSVAALTIKIGEPAPSAPPINATRSEEPSTSALPTNPKTVPLPKTVRKTRNSKR
ncbi:hypothetical protein EUTSA_v10002232mg [Eutrema salsugineum]|uniref:DUF1985 domain-containing protein n=1 Tax=Eutrema salsugineum TaxID=72664 RepID=V4M5C2_EUTSA|nr:hypothetical protein EUTSA_v10002232mg [Eutrema salsugineum]